MVFGCGIDIEEHHRFLKYFNPETPAHYFLSIFTPRELENYAKFDTHLCYAVSFSCKESFYKAFGGNDDNMEIDLLEIELIFLSSPEQGIAEVNFFGNAKKMVEKHHISLPPYFNYKLTESLVIFESILKCNQI